MITLKTVMKFNKLLAASRASGLPVHFHPPKKNRIFPMTERAQGVEQTKPTQGSDSSESGIVIDGIFFQSKEGKFLGEKLFAKQFRIHNKSESDTSKSTDSSGEGKTSVSQESSKLERTPNGFVRNIQQSGRKVESVTQGAFLNPYLAKSDISSQGPYSSRQNVAHMTGFDSDNEQETSDESNSESTSETEQGDSEGESKTHTETETVTESETESDSDKESEDESVSERGSEKESESGSSRKSNGTQEFVRSVLRTMNERRSSKPRFASTVAEISSRVGFNFIHNPYQIFEETGHKDKKEEDKKGSKKEETGNEDPKPAFSQEKDLSKSSKSQSKSSSSAGCSYTLGTTDKGNLPPIAEDEEEEMTSAGSLRSSLGSKFQQSASGTESPGDDTEDSDSGDAVSAD